MADLESALVDLLQQAGGRQTIRGYQPHPLPASYKRALAPLEQWARRRSSLTDIAALPSASGFVRLDYKAKYLRSHDSRHTHSWLLLAAGEHIKVAPKGIGHSAIGITAGYEF